MTISAAGDDSLDRAMRATYKQIQDSIQPMVQRHAKIEAQLAAQVQVQLRAIGFFEENRKLAEQIQNQIAPAVEAMTQTLRSAMQSQAFQRQYQELKEQLLQAAGPAAAMANQNFNFPALEDIAALGYQARSDKRLEALLAPEDELSPGISDALDRLNKLLADGGELAVECISVGIRIVWRILWLATVLYLAGNAPLAIYLLEVVGFTPTAGDKLAGKFDDFVESKRNQDKK